MGEEEERERGKEGSEKGRGSKVFTYVNYVS